jgi:hypothetical protein
MVRHIGSHTLCFSLDSASAVVQRNFAFHFLSNNFCATRRGGREGGGGWGLGEGGAGGGG